MNQEDVDPFQEEFGQHAAIVTKLTLQEIQIALSFLKRRFPRFSIQKIVSTLDHYHCRKNQGQLQRKHLSYADLAENRRPSRGRDLWNLKEKGQESREDQKLRSQENLRLVGRLFCEGGDDYKLAKRYIPELSVTSYRNMLLSIASSAFRQLVGFLRKQCKMSLKELSEPQKVTVKTALISAHEWMGTKSLQAIETLFKFIANKFNSTRAPITPQEAIQLYSVIARRVNHDSVDLLSMTPAPQFADQVKDLGNHRPPQRSPQDQTQLLGVIAAAFLEVCEEEQLPNHLIKKYGLCKAWEKEQLRLSLRKVISFALDRLASSQGKRYLLQGGKVTQAQFGKIMSPKHLNLQYALVQLYLDKLQSRKLIASLAKQINLLLCDSSPDSSERQSDKSGEYFKQRVSQRDEIVERTPLGHTNTFTSPLMGRGNGLHFGSELRTQKESISTFSGPRREARESESEQVEGQLSKSVLYFDD